MAKPMSSNLRVMTRFTNPGNAAPAADQKTTMSFEDLGKVGVAKTVTEEIPFPVTCMHVRGAVVFAAQLADGSRIGVNPVMPRNPVDPTQVLAPDNGEEGYVTLERSENCKLTKDNTGRIEFTIRPKFISWESVDARESRVAAEKAKQAQKAEGSK